MSHLKVRPLPESAISGVNSSTLVKVDLGPTREVHVYNDSAVNWYYKLGRTSDSNPTITATNNEGVIEPYSPGVVGPLKVLGMADDACIWLKAASGSAHAGRLKKFVA